MWPPLIAAALVAPLVQLWSQSYLSGTDAYYYALQADSVFIAGRPRIPDSSPLHYLTAAVMRAGLDAEQAVKIWMVTSLAIFSAAFGFLCSHKQAWPRTLPLILWPLLSPSVIFSAIEFPKSFSFMVVFTAALAVSATTVRLRWLVAATLLALSCFMHKMAFVYAAAFTAGLLCLYLPAPSKLGLVSLRRFPTGRVAVISTALALALCAFLLPDGLHPADLPRLYGSRLTPGAAALFMEPNLPLAIRIELALAALALLIICLKNSHGRRGALMALCLALPAFIPALGHESFSLGQRFGLLMPFSVTLAGVYLMPPVRPGSRRRPALWTALLIFIAALSFVRLDWSYPSRLNPPYEEYSKLTRLLTRQDIPMLIVPRDFHYYYKYQTGREAFSYEPEAHWPKERTWRLAWGITPEEFFVRLPLACYRDGHLKTLFPGSPFTLIREDCYQIFRGLVRPEESADLYKLVWSSPANPSQKRPKYLYRKHADDDTDDEFSALP
ncbi:hypothetical protein C4J81_00205 [Deltaproteobacteria bacterium Smac51]|nr:hypothetical protein C4J81_00205 [Deltaproteobacteria bacterium Smac51]